MQAVADASILDRVEKILQEVVQREPGVSSAAVMTAEGMPLVVLMGRGEEEKLELAAAIASLGSLSEQTASRLKIGSYKDLMLRCRKGHLLVRRVGTGAVLALLTDRKAQLGACYVVMESMSKRLHPLLK